MNAIPTVLVVYNRPHHTRRVIESLRPHSPFPIYVFCDGPKSHQDAQAVREVTNAVRGIDWTTPIVIKRDKNAGLAKSVVAAVDHALSLHETMILLEDDCVVGPYFYDFITTCLSRYKDDKRVVGITGYTVPIPASILSTYPYDVYFAPRPGSWGWATWRDRWQWYERDFVKGLARALKDKVDLKSGGSDIVRMIRASVQGHLDAWTPGWVLATARHGVFAYPTTSHVQNIGFDGTGRHCVQGHAFDTTMATTAPTRFPRGVKQCDSVLVNLRKYYR